MTGGTLSGSRTSSARAWRLHWWKTRSRQQTSSCSRAGSIVASLLPVSAHYVKAFGTLGADSLASSANREPRVALFYATDDDTAAGTVERLIRAAGFDPVKAGGFADAGRLEGPDGDLSQGGLKGELLDLDQARATLAATEVTA